MKRLALGVLVLGLGCAAPLAFAQEPEAGQKEAKTEGEEGGLTGWKWANFALLAGAIGYMAVKQGGPFFTARSRHIRKDMMEASDVRKEAEERAAAVDHKLANLAADIAALKSESEQERQAETEQLRMHRETERGKIQAHAQREIESAGKAARLELKRYAAFLAVELAQQKIQARMTGEVQNRLVAGFASEIASYASPSAPTH
jgi:F-type H+-transporting ATPase subunit b